MKLRFFNKHAPSFQLKDLSIQLAVVGDVLGDVASRHQLATLSHLGVLLTSPLRETPLLRHHNLLTTGELHLGTTQGLNHHLLLVVLRTDGDDRLADAHTSHQIVGLTEGVTHTRLQSIGAGARKHLVDTGHVVGVATHSHVEAVLASVLHQILVGRNTGSLQSLARQLLLRNTRHTLPAHARQRACEPRKDRYPR